MENAKEELRPEDFFLIEERTDITKPLISKIVELLEEMKLPEVVNKQAINTIPRSASSHVHITHESVGMSESDAKIFRIDILETNLRKFISGVQNHVAEVQNMEALTLNKEKPQVQKFSPKLTRRIHKASYLTVQLDSLLKRLELALPVLVDCAKTRGIIEGLNGYRSCILVVQRIMEKIDSTLDICPILPKNKTMMGSFWSTTKWRNSLQVLTDQLRTNITIIEKIVEHSSQIKDLFLTQETTSSFAVFDEENEFFKLLTVLPTECFFGIHFGTHYPPNVQKILRMIMLASAAFSTANKVSSSWIVKGPLSLIYGAYYNASSKDAAIKFVSNHNRANIQELKEFWNLTELPSFEMGVSLVTPGSLDMNYKLTIPPVFFEVETEDKKTIMIEPPKLLPSMKKPETMDIHLPVKVRLISMKKFTVDLRDVSKSWKESYESQQKRNDLVLRVRSFSFSGRANMRESMEKLQLKQEETKKEKEILSPYLIIHYHGGGFVAHTASSHMNYLKDWARDTNAPIFSVEYRLAPEFPFPIPFEESYYAYMWAVKNCRKLGSTGEKIILVGDSAGGNLAAAVTVKAIMDKTRIPDGLILIYPALYMHFVPSPARTLSVMDPMLPTPSLKECFKAYQQGGVDPIHNMFFSPASASDEVLQKFPQNTYVMCGTLDPLLDDSIFFCKRMAELKKKITLKLYDSFPHGFLNLAAFPTYGKELSVGVNQASTWMKAIFSSRSLQELD